MSRVLINALSVSVGGGLTYARMVFPLLLERLDDAVVLHGKVLSELPLENKNRIQVEGAATGGSTRFLWEGLHLARLLKRQRVDVLYTPYQVAVQPQSVRSVCVLRNLEPFFAGNYLYSRKSAMRNALLASLTRLSLAHADRIIAVSEFTRRFAVETLRIPEAKLVRVYHGRDNSLVPDETAADQAVKTALGIDGPFVFTAGSILPYRRLEDVVAAFEQAIARQTNDAVLLVAGSGTDRRYALKIRALVESSPFRSRIRLLGRLNGQEMRALYKGCHVFVSASEVEACPNIGIEAMTAGRPVIAANSGPAEEIYGDGAILYQPRDVASLASLLSSLWQSKELAGEMSKRAVSRSSAFSWDTCAAATADVLTDHTPVEVPLGMTSGAACAGVTRSL